MSVLVYSTCHIQYISNNDETLNRDYSERSLIEIRDSDDQKYLLHAKDLETKEEIFTITIESRDQYRFGKPNDQPDEIKTADGTYRLRLNKDSQQQFHDIFSSLLEAIIPLTKTTTTYSETRYTTTDNRSSTPKESNERKRTITPDPVYCNPKDILVDIHNFNQYIHQGNPQQASEIATRLASQGITLQAKPSEHFKNEDEFEIRVQFDGNDYGVEQNGGSIPVNVYPSTTIRELRAIFEHAYHYLPTSQYFFVNGKLVHDNATMRELKVGPKSLFILFLITHPKKFKKTGSWKCSACTSNNIETNLICHVCSASRTE